MKRQYIVLALLAVVAVLSSCKSTKKADTADSAAIAVGPAFDADSAYAFCEKQCDFGPRVMNSGLWRNSSSTVVRWLSRRRTLRLSTAPC